jgi:EmrB/QacA subfamily drug resistance transporter
LSPAGERPLGEVLDKRQKILLVVSLQAAMFVSAINQSVVATATPRVLADLGGFELYSWVFTVYMVASTVVVLPVGRLSDMFGRRLFILGGVMLFMLGSAACGAAQDMPQLIIARAIQGVGGGIIFSAVFAVLGDLFPPAERGKYMGLFTGTFTLASLIGPTVGGLLTDHATWRWCFYLNVPIGGLALAFIWMNLPEPKKKGGRLSSIDFLGSLLLSAATISLLVGLSYSLPEFGATHPETLALFGAAAAFTVAFGFQERRHAQPIFPLALFRNREFVLANVITLCVGAAGFGAIQFLPTFVQVSLGASATASGIVTTPQSLGLLATSIIGGQVLARTGRYRFQLFIGIGMMVLATIMLTQLTVSTNEFVIGAIMVLYGLGSGLVMPTMSVVIQNCVTHQLLGVATSARQFFMQIGNVLGVAVFGVVLASSYAAAYDDNLSDNVAGQLPASLAQEFKDDPTLSLDTRHYPAIEDDVLALPGGAAVLAAVLDAQKEAVAVAIRHIYTGSTVLVALSMVLVFFLKEIPLRRSFQMAEVKPASPGSATDGSPPSPIPAGAPPVTEPLAAAPTRGDPA